MPGDLNRVLLIGLVTSPPVERGKSAVFSVTTTQRWTTASGPRVKTSEHEVVVVYAGLVAVALKFRLGDRVFVEGAAEHPGVVVGALHSSLQLLRPASDEGSADI